MLDVNISIRTFDVVVCNIEFKVSKKINHQSPPKYLCFNYVMTRINCLCQHLIFALDKRNLQIRCGA